MEHHRITVEGSVVAQGATDFRETPPQRPERIVGPREQQRGQLAPGRCAPAEDQVRQQGPALATAELVRHPAGLFDPRTAQQVDSQSHTTSAQARRAAAVSTRGSGKSSQYW